MYHRGNSPLRAVTAVIAVGVVAGPLCSCSADRPRATAPTAGAVAVAPQPRGPVPAGWVSYRGSSLPFALAHPGGWLVDDSAAPVGETTFTEAGDEPIAVTVTGRPAPQPLPAPDVLRARLVGYTTRSCETGRRVLDRGALDAAGVTFATATVRCEGEDEGAAGQAEEDEGATYFVGVAVKGGTQWTFAFRTSNDDFAEDRPTVIRRALESFNV